MLHARIDRVVYVSDPCISMTVCVAESVVGESPSLCVSSFSFDRYSHSLFIQVFCCVGQGNSHFRLICIDDFQPYLDL